MLQELIEAIAALEEAGVPVYQTVGPADTLRLVVVTPYAAASFYGDDANLLDVPKVQIDVYTPDLTDTLPDTVMGLLQSWHLPYTVEDLQGYEPETNRLRTILQAEVI